MCLIIGLKQCRVRCPREGVHLRDSRVRNWTKSGWMWQEIPGTQLDLPTLSRVAHWILDSGYLSGEDISNLTDLNPVFAAPYLLDLPISRPWSPVRKRIWGFGKVQPLCS